MQSFFFNETHQIKREYKMIGAIMIIIAQLLCVNSCMKLTGLAMYSVNNIDSFIFNTILMVIFDLAILAISYCMFGVYTPGLVTCLLLGVSIFSRSAFYSYDYKHIIEAPGIPIVLFLLGLLFILKCRTSISKNRYKNLIIGIAFFVAATMLQIYVFYFSILLIWGLILSELLYKEKKSAVISSFLMIVYVLFVALYHANVFTEMISQILLGNKKELVFPYLINVDYCFSFISQDTLYLDWYLDRFVLMIIALCLFILCAFITMIFVLCRKEKWYPSIKEKTVAILSRITCEMKDIVFCKKKEKSSSFVIVTLAFFASVFCMARCLDVWTEYNYVEECTLFLMPVFILILVGIICVIAKRIKWDFTLLQFVIFLVSIIDVLIIAKMKNIPQNYDQFVVENLAFLGTNKSNELTIFYSSLVILLVVAILIGVKYTTNNIKFLEMNKEKLNFLKVIKKFAIFYILFLLSTYGIVATINLFVFVPNVTMFYYMLAFVFSLLCLFQKDDLQRKVILVLQLILPFSLLTYVNMNYQFRNNYIKESGSVIYFIFVFITVILLCYMNIIYIKKVPDEITSNQMICSHTSYLSKYSCMVVAAFSSFPGASLVVNDMHHPGEIIVSFMEVFNKGCLLYDDYIPVSGLFSIVLGGINELLGGKYVYSSQTSALFCLLISMLTAYILCSYLERDNVLVIVFFVLLAYSPYIVRTQWILPFVLLLFLPSLKKYYQLHMYILFSIFLLLYYPVYGVAFAVGMFPYETKMVYDFYCEVRKDGIKINIPKVLISISTIVFLAISIPILIKMAKHILVYSSQSLLADGYTVMGQAVPNNFLPFLEQFGGIRILLYYAIWFMLPISLLSTCSHDIGRIIKDKFKFKRNDRRIYMLVFIVLFTMIGFSYSQMRVEENLMGRTASLLFPIIPIILFIVWKYEFQKNVKLVLYWGVMVCAAFLYRGSSLVESINIPFSTCYNVPDEMVYLNEDIGNLGKGFYYENIIEDCVNVIQAKNRYCKSEIDVSYTGLYFSQIYGADLKTIGQPNMVAMKSKAAIDETVNLFANRDVVVSDKMTPYGQYRWNKYLLTSDEMIYDKTTNCFVTPNLADRLKIVGDNKGLYQYGMDNIGALANTLGKSYDFYGANWLEKGTAFLQLETEDINSLMENDSQINMKNYYYHTSIEQDCAQNDFIYINITGGDATNDDETLVQLLTWNLNNVNVVVMVSWTNSDGSESEISAYLGDGVLLIPLGMNSNWFTNPHEEIEISIISSARDVSEYEISDVQFYRLTE